MAHLGRSFPGRATIIRQLALGSSGLLSISASGQETTSGSIASTATMALALAGQQTTSGSLATRATFAVAADGKVVFWHSLLSTDQASFENGLVGWSTLNGWTAQRSTDVAYDGSYSLKLTAGTAPAIAATTPTGTNGVSVLPSSNYTAGLRVQAGSTARNISCILQYYLSDGTPSGNNQLAGSEAAAGTWSLFSFNASTGSSDAYAALQIQINATTGGENHYIDAAFILAGTVASSQVWPPNPPILTASLIKTATLSGTESTSGSLAATVAGITSASGSESTSGSLSVSAIFRLVGTSGTSSSGGAIAALISPVGSDGTASTSGGLATSVIMPIDAHGFGALGFYLI